jgi:hypothetical protein
VQQSFSKDKQTGEVTRPLLLIEASYRSPWRFYESIGFQDGTTEELSVDDRSTHDCTQYSCKHVEQASIFLTSSKLLISKD